MLLCWCLSFNSETIALEDPNYFFPAFDALTSPHSAAPEDLLSSKSTTPLTAEQTYTSAVTRLTLAGLFADPGSRELFDMALSLHAATPKIEAFYQYYSAIHPSEINESRACDSWVDWDGEWICDVEILKQRLQSVAKAESNPIM